MDINTLKNINIAIGSKDNCIHLGNIRYTHKNEKFDIYYHFYFGENRKRIFNVNEEKYVDMKKFHFSLHDSGEGHYKICKNQCVVQKGVLSDKSRTINSDSDLAILGIESFDLSDFSERNINIKSNTIYLNPPISVSRYSIMWMLVPPSFPDELPSRMLWYNVWGHDGNNHHVQSSSTDDILMSRKLTHVLSIDGWRVCVCYIKDLLPVLKLTDMATLQYPNGKERAWRAFVFIDAHIPLSQLLTSVALKKRRIFTSSKPHISEKSRDISAWIKY